MNSSVRVFGPARAFVDRDMWWALTLSVIVVFVGAFLLAIEGRFGLALAISVLVGCVSRLANPPAYCVTGESGGPISIGASGETSTTPSIARNFPTSS